MHRIRALAGHLAYGLLGAVTGIGSAVLWLHILTPQRLWAVAVTATCFALLAIGGMAAIHRRRARRPRRRAHARPQPTKTRKAT